MMTDTQRKHKIENIPGVLGGFVALKKSKDT